MIRRTDMPIVGYRMWFWRGDHILRSSYSSYHWHVGENVATCQLSSDVKPCETAPTPECRCGLHAYATVEHPVWASVCHESEYSSVTSWCVGAVLLYGTVLVGENILRASHAQPLAFVNNGRGLDAAIDLGLPHVNTPDALTAMALEHGVSAPAP